MDNKWKKMWNVIGAITVAITLVVGTTIIVHPAVSELVGLAVAQTSTKWNSVNDAAKGDGLTSGILAQSTYLFNGVTFDRLRGALAADGSAVTGLLSAQLMGLNTAGTYDRIRAGLTADAFATGTGLLNNGNMVFNATTWDRQRTASADALAVTGMTAVGNMVWNGASNDRWRSASATNNTATTSLGGAQVTQLSTWFVIDTDAGATQTTATKAAGGGTVRHVATNIHICYNDTAAATGSALVHLRDGATGAGTIIKTWIIGIPVAGDSKCIDLSGMNRTGTANTAMTLEFAAAQAATATTSVTLEGYSTP